MARTFAHDDAALATVAVSTAVSVSLSAGGADRTIFNDTDKKLYVRFGSVAAAAAACSIAMAAGSYLEVPFGYAGPIQGRWEAAATGTGAQVTTFSGG